MQVYTEIDSLVKILQKLKLSEKSIGLVPTMGALHEGHIELVKKSTKENEITVCSIFVNPAQFNNPEDLKNYPKNIDSDIDKLKLVDCDIVFTPDVNEMYEDKRYVSFDFGYLENIMEGKCYAFG